MATAKKIESELFNSFRKLDNNKKGKVLEFVNSLIESKEDKVDKTMLLDSLFGAWKDTDENLVKSILESRTTSNKEISFDN